MKVRQIIKKYKAYVIALGIGLILTPFAIRFAYMERGYFAIGGEWFVLPLILLAAVLRKEIKEFIKEVCGDDEQNMSADER